MSDPIRSALASAAFGLLATSALGQWTSNSAANTLIAGGSGDQTQPKVAPTADGGAYISWFDGIATGFDVRLQRIDAAGSLMFPAGGVLVADRGFSSTQDYGLDVDASGAALLAFRDDSGSGVQISLARVAANGTVLLAPTPLTNTSAFVAAPVVAGTANGDAVVAWTQDNQTKAQRVDMTGSPVWTPEVTLTPGAGSFVAADMHDAGSDVILAFVHQTGGFSSPRHLLAQKLDSTGALVWGSSHVTVFDGGSLQFGNFPDFEPDGLGGAVFGWYDAGSLALQCRAQHVDAAGNEVFPHNGVELSTNTSRIRVSPSVSYDGATGEIFAAWTEQSTNQAMDGVWAQKIDGSGSRAWTDSGVELVPLGSADVTNVRALATGGRTLVFWDSASSFGQDQIFGARIDRTGSVDINAFDVASTIGGKSRLVARRSNAGFALLAWVDERTDAGDIYAQNVSPEGGLSDGSVGTPYCFCNFAAPCANTETDGGCSGSHGDGARAAGNGSTSVSADDLVITVTDAPPAKSGLIFMGAAMVRAPFGDGLRCVGAGGMGTHRFGVQNSGAAGQYEIGPGIAAFSLIRFSPPGHIQPGQTWNFQAWFRDPMGPCATGFNTSSALSVTFAP